MDTSLVAQMVKNLPAMQEIGVRSMGWEDPLQKGMATHSIILAWRIPWTEEPGAWSLAGCSPWVQRVGYDWATNTHTSVVYICQSQSPNSSHPSFPTLMSICLFSMSVSLFSVLQIRSSMCGCVLHEIKNQYRCLSCFFERDEWYWETFVSYWEMTQVRWKHFKKVKG